MLKGWECEKEIVNEIDYICTADCHFNAVKFVTILHSALRWQWQNISHSLDSQKTPHTSPVRPRPHGRPMGCLLWGFWRKLTALKRHPTVLTICMINSSSTREMMNSSSVDHPCNTWKTMRASVNLTRWPWKKFMSYQKWNNSNATIWSVLIIFLLKYTCVLEDLIVVKSTLVVVMAWCYQTSLRN